MIDVKDVVKMLNVVLVDVLIVLLLKKKGKKVDDDVYLSFLFGLSEIM